MNEAKKPRLSAALFAAIVLACMLADFIAPGQAARMDLTALSLPPSPGHPLGTDEMGRDLWGMLLHGGRVSLFIGLLASGISAALAIVYGAAAGLAPAWLDRALMRLTELLMSLPSLLYVIYIMAILGRPNAVVLALAIGAASWMNVAKIVRAEVRQIHRSEYILSARLSGASFGYILSRHLWPNFMPSIMFMLIYNVSQAIAAEATLSFLGLGLPPGEASWGSLMSLSRDALLTDSWWIIFVPSIVLIVSLVCITGIGEYFRSKAA